jgi:hypothetical protein
MKNLINVFKLLLLLAVLSASSNTNLLAQLPPKPQGVTNLTAMKTCFLNEIELSWNSAYGLSTHRLDLHYLENDSTISVVLNADALYINAATGKICTKLVGYMVGFGGLQITAIAAYSTGQSRGSYMTTNVLDCQPTGSMNIPLYIESIDGIASGFPKTISSSIKTYRATGAITVKFYQNSNPAAIDYSYWSAPCQYSYPSTTTSTGVTTGLNSLGNSSISFMSSVSANTVKISVNRTGSTSLESKLVYAVVLQNGTPIDVYAIFARSGIASANYCTNSDGSVRNTNSVQTAKTASLTDTEAPINIYPSLADQNISLAYTLPEAASVQVAIFNTMGEKMNYIADNMPQEAGSHEQNINVANLPKGIYFVRFQQGEAVQTRRFVKM